MQKGYYDLYISSHGGKRDIKLKRDYVVSLRDAAYFRSKDENLAIYSKNLLSDTFILFYFILFYFFGFFLLRLGESPASSCYVGLSIVLFIDKRGEREKKIKNLFFKFPQI